ncbi:hypothetical protein APHAL10511_000990 [Amanita phalloides]|nr:hypothetical protein APHAL10511_000990 [Amanita phalloides]
MPYQLTTSIRYDRNDADAPFLLLDYHYLRLLDAADRHAWEDAKAALNYDSLKSACEKAAQAAEARDERVDQFKIRVLLTERGVLTATASPAYHLPTDPFIAARFNPDSGTDPPWGLISSVRIDTQPTPTSIFTSTKTTRREHYDAARSRANLLPLPQATTPDDVLLYNSEGEITESSVSNVALYRDGKWLTPPLSTGCLKGVIRRWLLEHGLVEEAEKGVLMKDSIQVGDWILLSNAVSGCRLGRIEMSESNR